VAFVIIIAASLFGKSVLGGVGLAIAAYLAIGTLLAFAKKTQNFKIWRTVPAGTYGFVLAFNRTTFLSRPQYDYE